MSLNAWVDSMLLPLFLLGCLYVVGCVVGCLYCIACGEGCLYVIDRVVGCPYGTGGVVERLPLFSL